MPETNNNGNGTHVHRFDALPDLKTLLNQIKQGASGRLRWPHPPTVPVIACPHCERVRADDGTRCMTCDAYADRTIQAAFERWLHDQVLNRNTMPQTTAYDAWQIQHINACDQAVRKQFQ